MKRKLLPLVVALTVAGVTVFTAAIRTMARADVTSIDSENERQKALAFAGHTYRITVDNGSVFQNTYSADGTRLHAEILAGQGQGTTIDVALNVATVSAANKVYFVSWVEPDTTTVSHVMHLHAGTVQIFFTHTNASGARIGELHNATLRQIK
jgi:arabinogalactan endo-1,4-beta-galactosidase